MICLGAIDIDHKEEKQLPMAKLSQELHRYFFEEERPEEVTLGNIFALTGERMFGFPLALIAFFGMFPLPGTSIVFGVTMLLLTLQLCTGQRRPWVPGSILRKSFRLEKLQGLMRQLIPWLQRIEKITSPRFTVLCTSIPGRIFLGVVMSISALVVVLPIPGANTIPSLGIFLGALGLQEDDGVLSLAGMLISLAFVVFLAVVGIVAITTGVNLLTEIKTWLLHLVSHP